MKKAQISLEFIFAIGLIIFMFILLLFVIFERKMQVDATGKILEDKEECNKLANIITLAFISKSNHTFSLKKDATISPLSQVVTAGDTGYPCSLSLNKVSNPAGDIIFNLTAGNVNLNYVNNSVEVKNA